MIVVRCLRACTECRGQEMSNMCGKTNTYSPRSRWYSISSLLQWPSSSCMSSNPILRATIVTHRTRATSSARKVVGESLVSDVEGPEDTTHVPNARGVSIVRSSSSILHEFSDCSDCVRVALIVWQPPVSHVFSPEIDHTFPIGGRIDVAVNRSV